MGTSYSFSLCFGFELEEQAVKAPFKKQISDPGEFHMEDRFDPKNGDKIAPEKVWDRKPKKISWLEIDGEELDYHIDPEDLADILEKKFGCFVQQYGSWSSGELTWVFQVNDELPWKEATDFGHITLYADTLSLEQITVLMPKALELRFKLEEAGYSPGEPRVFIATKIN